VVSATLFVITPTELKFWGATLTTVIAIYCGLNIMWLNDAKKESLNAIEQLDNTGKAR